MKTKILNNIQKQAFIDKVQAIDVKSAYRAEFTKIVRPRSLNSNAYLWLCLAIAEDYTGTDKGVFYQYYLQKFPTFKEEEVFGQVSLVQISSSMFDSKQMSLFIEKVRHDLAEEGIHTPDHEDKRLEDIYKEMQMKGLL